MKLKGISRIEQFADKIVFALFAVFLLFVLVMQVGLLGGTPTVKVAGKDVPIDQADAAVKVVADAKYSRMESDRVDENLPATLPSAMEKYRDAMAMAAKGTNARLGRVGVATIKGTLPGGTELAGTTAPGGDENFVALQTPAPGKPLAGVFEGTIDPISVAQVGPELAKLVPAAQPFDVRTVTVMSEFDAAQLRAALRGGGGGPAIPSAFWQGRVELFDVEVVRQELGSDGQWGGDVTLGQHPGRPSMRSTLARTDLDPLSMRGLLDEERASREAIRRPEMYRTVSGAAWSWPVMDGKGAEAQKQATIDRLMRELRGVRGEIDRLQRQLGGDRPGQPPRGPAGGGDRSSREETSKWPSQPMADVGRGQSDADEFVWPQIPLHWMAQAGGGRQPNQPSQPSRPDAREALTKRLEAQRVREADLVKELEGMGVSVDPAAGPAMREKFEEPLTSLTDEATTKVTVWSHDFTAQPGGVYRYKTRVLVTNPYFGQADRLKEAVRELAKPVTSASAFSDWSEKVRVAPSSVYFVRSATVAGQDVVAGQSRVSVDMYEFFYGYWRRATASLSPGDPVIGTTDELPALETWRIETDEKGQWVTGAATALERRRTLSGGAILLDVLTVVGGERSAAMAVLADAAGGLFTMSAESGGTGLRGALEASASAGLRAATRLPSGEAGAGDRPEDRGGGAPPPPPPGGGPPPGPGDR